MFRLPLPVFHCMIALCLGAAGAGAQVRPPLSPPVAGDSLVIERYENGALKYLILARDSGACRELHLNFYRSGRLMSRGCQGSVQNAEVSTGMSIGTWTYFNQATGRPDSSIYYHNSILKTAFIEKRRYYPSGRLRVVERYNNYALYETEERRIGDWKYYAEDGRLLRTVRHAK